MPPDQLDLPDDFPLGKEALVFYLRHVPVGARRLQSDPGALEWLRDPAVCAAPRGKTRILADLWRLDPAAGADPCLRALRRQRGRELIRIGLRDLAGVAGLEETTADLSDLADICLAIALESKLAPLVAAHGDPGTPFAIMGLGKLGGRELNFCSDIDVIFLYGEEGGVAASGGAMTRHRFFNLLAERVASAFSAPSPDGPLFRIDLRLRPEGTAGPLAWSLEAMETYYAARGEIWERMALTKARLCAGDEELGYEFLQRLQPFIYPRHIHPGTLDEIAALKARIEREIVTTPNLERHIKLGRGGIREIEFVVQAHQILHGARHPFLQEANTLKALERLPLAGLLDGAEAARLAEAYRLLRAVEHRLQMPEEIRAHTLPESQSGMEALAEMTGYASGKTLASEIATRRAAVRSLFERTVESELEAEPPPIDLKAFEDPATAGATLDALALGPAGVHRTARTAKSFLALRPALVSRLSLAGDPDAALARFAQFAERYGSVGLLFESLASNPRLLDLLVGLFDQSPFLSEVAIRRPQIIEEIARDGSLGQARDVAAHLARFRANDERLDPLEWARVYRREAILRVALRDILGFATLDQVVAEYSAVADAALLFCIETLQMPQHLMPGIVALGKFGGRELGYGSDLDLFFVGGTPQTAARLSRAMGALTAEGILFPIDARLRPDGESSPLTFSLEQFLEYHSASGRADFWEKQILTKARAVTSEGDAEALVSSADRIWREAGQDPALWERIREMIKRVIAARSGGDERLAIKTGRGGLMMAEFLVQGKLMRLGVRETGTLAGIDRLAAEGVLGKGDASEIRESYMTLRRMELALRRRRNERIEALPSEQRALRQLAVRLGFEDVDGLFDAAHEARKGIAGAFERLARD